MNIQNYGTNVFAKTAKRMKHKSSPGPMSYVCSLAVMFVCLPGCDWLTSQFGGSASAKASGGSSEAARRGPKFPEFAGLQSSAPAVEPTLLRLEHNFHSQCRECRAATADTILIVAGSSKGHAKQNAQAIERASQGVAGVCGAEQVVTLYQPSKAELRRVLLKLRDRLAGWIFVGHGFSEGLLLNDAAWGSQYPLAPNHSKLLSPSQIGEYLDGAFVPSVGIFSCNQGGEVSQEWAWATKPEKLLIFDGPAAISDIAELHVGNFLQHLSCAKRKCICRPGVAE